MGKQRLFISYCWKDGNTYADELETQLKDAILGILPQKRLRL